MLKVDIVHKTDVLVCGATSAAVAAALSAKERGVAVMAVSDRSYFGEETAGALRLWQEESSEHELFRRVCDPGEPWMIPNPGRVKRVFDEALLEADIPFYFEARPVFLLQDDQGRVAGVVFASRTALYGVRCRVVVDASRTGVLARLAGLPLRRFEPSSSRELVVWGAAPEGDGPFSWHPTQTPLSVAGGEMSAYRLRLSTPERTDRESCLAADFEDRERLHYPGIVYSADCFLDSLDERLVSEGELKDDWRELAVEDLICLDGRLVLANGLLPLTKNGEAALNGLAGQLGVGSRAGSAAAERALNLSLPAGPLTCCAGEGQEAPGLRFAEPLKRPAQGAESQSVQVGCIPLFADCDVVVAGGGTAGAPAGIAAARSGARTLVLERLHGLGGLGTLGLITHYWYGNRVGFTAEIDAGVAACAKKAFERSGQWNPEDKMGWYLRALREAGGRAWLGSFAFGVQVEGSRVTGVLVSTPYGTGLVRCGAVVEATGNADIAAAAGAPCRVIDHRHVAVQGTGLPSRIPGVHYRNSDHTFIDDTDALGVSHAYVNARAKFVKDFDVAVMVGSRGGVRSSVSLRSRLWIFSPDVRIRTRSLRPGATSIPTGSRSIRSSWSFRLIERL